MIYYLIEFFAQEDQRTLTSLVVRAETAKQAIFSAMPAQHQNWEIGSTSPANPNYAYAENPISPFGYHATPNFRLCTKIGEPRETVPTPQY